MDKSKIKVFCVAETVENRKLGKLTIRASCILAETLEEATGYAYIKSKKEYPSAHGWSDHNIVVAEIKLENLERAGYVKEKEHGEKHS